MLLRPYLLVDDPSNSRVSGGALTHSCRGGRERQDECRRVPDKEARNAPKHHPVYFRRVQMAFRIGNPRGCHMWTLCLWADPVFL